MSENKVFVTGEGDPATDEEVQEFRDLVVWPALEHLAGPRGLGSGETVFMRRKFEFSDGPFMVTVDFEAQKGTFDAELVPGCVTISLGLPDEELTDVYLKGVEEGVTDISAIYPEREVGEFELDELEMWNYRVFYFDTDESDFYSVSDDHELVNPLGNQIHGELDKIAEDEGEEADWEEWQTATKKLTPQLNHADLHAIIESLKLLGVPHKTFYAYSRRKTFDDLPQQEDS